MAQDKMKNDDVDRKMGRAGQDDDTGKQDFGRQTPGRNPQHDQQTGQKGEKKNPLDDDELGEGGAHQGRQGESGRMSGED